MATTAECAANAVLLAQAQLAQHKLLTGARVVEVHSADKSVSYYNAGNVEALERYIRKLQDVADACAGVRTRGRLFHMTPE